MRIDILTVVPELLESPLQHYIVGRAQQQGFLELHVHNIRDYATNKWRRVDDYPFGGEAGMILQIEPIDRAIADLKSQRHYDEVIYTSPDGETFDQGIANQMSLQENLIILCGHYKGIDQRIREHLITREISVVRLLPGVIGDAESALSDTFQDDLLAPPIYTRPADYKGWKVPDVLLSGHAARIEAWKMECALERTKRLRPDLYKKHLGHEK